MVELLGWSPVHGSGGSVPVLKMEATDTISALFDVVPFSKMFPIGEYVIRTDKPELGVSSVLNLDELKEMSKYFIHFSDGTIASGISDVYLVSPKSGSNYYHWLIFGVNSYYNDGDYRRLFYESYAPTSPDEPLPTFRELAKGERHIFIRYNQSLRDLSIVGITDSGYIGTGAWVGSIYKGGTSDISYETLEIYDSEDEANSHSGSSPYNPGGNSTPAGGGGNFGNDRESEDLTPLIPNGSSENDLVDAGIFTRYLVNNAQLKEFAKWLFVDNWGEAIWRELTIATFGNIYDSLISVMSYPFAVGQLPGITTVSGNIYLGSLNSGASSSGILAKSFSQIDWGTISITEYWGNFLDYAPHTKIQLFLPWGTGFVDIDPNEVMNGTLQVKTNIELSKGTCVHIVYTGEGAIIGTYNGFCGAQYPITAVDTSGKAIGAAIAGISLAVAGASGAIAKEAGARGTHALQVASATTNAGYPSLPHLRMAGLEELHKEATYNAISSGAAKVAATSSLAAARIPAAFNRNGSFAPNAAGMMPQKPFIVMTWPDQSVPEQYGSHVGYPSNIYISLGRLRGYTEVGAIHLDGINCTEHEREELMSLLQGGVIL